LKVSELLVKNNIHMPAYCGGRGTCGKCKVQILGSANNEDSNSANSKDSGRCTQHDLPVSDADKRLLSIEEIDAGIRLACRLDADGIDIADIKPLWEKEDDFAALGAILATEIREADSENVAPEASLSPETHEADSATDPSDHTNEKVSIAVDIGTTTIAVALLGKKGTVIDSITGINHGRSYGADVVSRIEASCNGKAKELTTLLRDDVKKLILSLINKKGINLSNIERVAIAGNTTMEHILLGYSLEGMCGYPFTPVDLKYTVTNWYDLFCQDSAITESGELFCQEKSQKIKVEIMPGISAFVGADIYMGILNSGINNSSEISLLIDLGTNGEMALGNRERILVTSTAAGPAFEGGNISCGIGSIPGAVCSVEIASKKRLPQIRTIAGKTPVGICGTGIIEAIYELRKTEIIDENGTFLEEYSDGYQLCSGIMINQEDIRQLQIAKSAIRSGVEVLMAEYGINAADVSKIYIAGGFGSNLNVAKAIGIGLIPDTVNAEIIAAGNTSLLGVTDVISGKYCRDDLVVGSNIEEIVLAGNPEFESLYINNMYL